MYTGIRQLIGEATPEHIGGGGWGRGEKRPQLTPCTATAFFEGFEERFELAISGDPKTGKAALSPTEIVLTQWLRFQKIVH